MRCSNEILGNTTRRQGPSSLGVALEQKGKWAQKARNIVKTKVPSVVLPRAGLLS